MLLGLAAALPAAQAQTGQWPDKPVRVVVPFAPGGGTDIVARVISARLSDSFGQQFVSAPQVVTNCTELSSPSQPVTNDPAVILV